MGLLNFAAGQAARMYLRYPLNLIRLFSIIVMILVFVSQTVDLSHDFKVSKAWHHDGNKTSGLDYIPGSNVSTEIGGLFWNFLDRFFIMLFTLLLILAELAPDVRIPFLDNHFSVLGCQSGVGPTGFFQALLAANVLARHVEMFAFVTAFMMFIAGCMNMLIGLILRSHSRHVRQVFGPRRDVNADDSAAIAIDPYNHAGPGDVEKGGMAQRFGDRVFERAMPINAPPAAKIAVSNGVTWLAGKAKRTSKTAKDADRFGA